MNVLDDIKAMIVSGVGMDPSLIYRDFVPADPDIVVSLLGYGSGAPEEVFGSTVASLIALPARVQIVVRGAAEAGGYDAASTLADRIWATVYGVNLTVGERRYHSIKPSQGPFFLDRDSARRPSLAWNVELLAAR